MLNDENNDETRRPTQRSSYLSERDMRIIIADPMFTQPMTVNNKVYVLYRGRRLANVLTLRFNTQSSLFNPYFMARNAIDILDQHFAVRTVFSYCVDYDVVLSKINAIPKSFYVWRANSNRTYFNASDEITMTFTHANILRLCQDAYRVHLPSLNLNFRDSGCAIDGLLSIVLSFIV
jgi:hypothetical protein